VQPSLPHVPCGRWATGLRRVVCRAHAPPRVLAPHPRTWQGLRDGGSPGAARASCTGSNLPQPLLPSKTHRALTHPHRGSARALVKARRGLKMNETTLLGRARVATTSKHLQKRWQPRAPLIPSFQPQHSVHMPGHGPLLRSFSPSEAFYE